MRKGLEETERQIPQLPFARRRGVTFGVEVVDFGELKRRNMDHSIFRAHRIEFHILFLVTDGQGQHMVDFTLFPVERGKLIWIAPGQVQYFDGTNHLSGFLILFQPEVCGIKAPLLRWPTALRPADGDFELFETLTDLIFGLKNRELSTPHDRLAWRMLSAILELWEGAANRDIATREQTFNKDLEAFEALLEKHFMQHRDVSWYARKVGYSEKTLSRWCRSAAGVNAKAYIDRRVALEAKRLLVHTDHGVERIATRLGFSESTNFVKFFKRLEGQTPSLFRASWSRRLGG